MEPDSPNKTSLLSERAQQLQKLFDEKTLDLFVKECEQLRQEGVDLKQMSSAHKLDYDMEEQYHSMKRVMAESQKLL